ARQTYESLRARGADVRVIGVNETGEMDMESLERALADGARLVSVMHVNGETGAVSDIPAIHARIAGRALLHVDGVQGFLRVPFDMKSCDLYSVSAHKILGPKGVGALIYRGSVKLAPLAHGGGQEDGLRSGTEDTPGIAGFREAMRVMAEIDLDDMMATKMHLIRAFQTAVPSACINGPDPKFAAPHIVNMSFPGVRGEVMLHALEADGIYVSTGAACSSKKQKVSAVLTAMGIPQSRAECALRFSISPYTTRAEIDVAAESLQKNYERLKRFQRR
ncbi:MAG: cysteine desulfurase family protein, partial [Christensenellales bacterium]